MIQPTLVSIELPTMKHHNHFSFCGLDMCISKIVTVLKHNSTTTCQRMAYNVSFASAVAANIICSILLVLVNKLLVLKFHFDYMVLLTALHFLASFSLCLFGTLTGCSKYKNVNNYLSIFRISMVS